MMVDKVDIDVEHFILEVKRRPVLWDTNHSDYNQRHAKFAAWEEVLANLYVDWCDLSNYDKFGRVRDIQSRWKNLRDCYIRELKYERKVEKGLALAKKNKYKYSHLLGFLNQVDKRKDKGSDQSSTDIEESPQKIEENKSHNAFPELKRELESSTVQPDRKSSQMNLNGNRKVKRLKADNLMMQSLKVRQLQPDNSAQVLSDSSTLDSDCNNQSVNEDGMKAKQSNTPKEALLQMHGSVEVEINKNQPLINQSFQEYLNNELVKKSNIPKEALLQLRGSVEMERSKNPTLINNQTFQEYINGELSHKVDSEYLSPSVEIHPGFSSLPLEQDDDKMFLLSLLPYLKKLNEERKLEARIEISSMLRKMIYNKC